MAAIAAANVASSFPSSLQNQYRIRSKNLPSGSLLKFASSRILQPPASSHSQSISFGPLCSRWKPPKKAAALAQGEAAVMAATREEEEIFEEEADKGGEESLSDSSTKLYFGSLPYHVDSAQLAGLVQDFASPELVEVLYDKRTGKSRGFAFVTMSTIEDCNIVIQNLDGREYGGRTLRVNFSDKPRPKVPLYPESEYKLFVGNLSWSVTSESLALAFSEYGNVVGARVLFDGETGRSRGYGFVCFETKDEMDAAMAALDGEDLEGRAIRISIAQGKKE